MSNNMSNVKQHVHEKTYVAQWVIVMFLACLGIQEASAEPIRFSSSRRTRPRTVSINRSATAQGRSVAGQGRTVEGASVGKGEPIREFMGVQFGVPIAQSGATATGIIEFSPRYFMFAEAFPMCSSSRKISGFRSEARSPISSPDQARQMLLRIKADLERRTGCPMELSDKSTIRMTEYEYSGRFTDVRISVRISDDDRSAKFYFEINNNRWVRNL